MTKFQKIFLLWLGWVIFTALIMADSFALLVFANEGVALSFWQSAFAVAQELALPAVAGMCGTHLLVRLREKKTQRLNEAP